MTERPRSSEIAIVVLAVAVTIGALASLRLDGLERFLAFAVLIAASELFEITLPNDARFPLGLAPALGLALLGPIHPVAAGPSFAEIMVAFALGSVLAIGARVLLRRSLLIVEACIELLLLAAGSSVYLALRDVGGLPIFDVERSPTSTDLAIAGFVALFIVVLVLNAVIHALRMGQQEQVSPVPFFHGLIRASIAPHLSILSVGALLAVSYPALRFWSFPLFLAPLAATQFAFRQFASIRRTYLQTIRALSKVPEMAGYTHPGHSTRVAELSVAIARELSVAEDQIDEIEYAALLHDIGRVSIPDPSHTTSSGTMELAVVGAAIVRETGHFPQVAEMIERQHDPYRRRGAAPSTNLPIGARIIKVASAFDDRARPGGIAESTHDVLARLDAASDADFDPDVVGALRRVLEKQSLV